MGALHIVLAIVVLMLRPHAVPAASTASAPILAPVVAPPTATQETRRASGPHLVLFDAMNAERAKAGLPLLGYDSRLEQAGELRVADMIEHGYIDHRSPDGMEYPQAVHAAGFKSFAWAGENIYATNETPDVEAAAHWATEKFMGSPTHRAILLDPAFDHVGIGLGQGADGVWIFAVIFLGGGQ